MEDGWNGVEFTDASQCWARNLTILNGDTLISVHRSSFCTVANITTGVWVVLKWTRSDILRKCMPCIWSDHHTWNHQTENIPQPLTLISRHLYRTAARQSPDGRNCHHGLNVSASQDVLVANVSHGIVCVHDLCVFNFTVNNMTMPKLTDSYSMAFCQMRWCPSICWEHKHHNKLSCH